MKKGTIGEGNKVQEEALGIGKGAGFAGCKTLELVLELLIALTLELVLLVVPAVVLLQVLTGNRSWLLVARHAPPQPHCA